MIDKTRVGKRIAALRRLRGLSQAALAERLCVSAQAVSKWERGQALPDVDILLELCWMLEVSVDALLGGDGFAGARTSLPEAVRPLSDRPELARALAAAAPYCAGGEAKYLAELMGEGKLEIGADIWAGLGEKRRDVPIPWDALSDYALRELAPMLRQAMGIVAGGADRGLRRILDRLRCPKCRGALQLSPGEGDGINLKCAGDHVYPVIEGVVDFGGREIRGELWSLYLKNYEQYLQDRAGINPNERRGEPLDQVMWERIRALRPHVILDVASGMGKGVEFYLPHIDWPCVVIMTDLSHRILKWNRQYFAQTYPNPLVDMVYLACDCADMPVRDGAIDVITSLAGFESMQAKRMDGFGEAKRALRPSGNAVYTMCIVEGDQNSEKWIRSMQDAGVMDELPSLEEMMITRERWLEVCRETGYISTEAVRMCGEMPAPGDGRFPFENSVLQWTAKYVMVSRSS